MAALRLIAVILLACVPAAVGSPDAPSAERALAEHEAQYRRQLPESPAGRELAWFLSVLRAEQALGEPRERFAEVFFDRLNPDQFVAVVEQYRTQVFSDDLTVLRVKPGATERSVVAVIGAKGRMGPQVFDASLALDQEGKINSMWLLVSRPEKLEIPGWDEVDYRLAVYPGRIGFAAMRERGGDGRLELLHGVNERASIAIASVFKLSIIEALCEAAFAGEIEWAERLTIGEEHVSLATFAGAMKEGDEGSVLDLASRMYAISDNTATDRLIHRLGRERVESYYVRHHASPGPSLPLLTTREAFTLKLTPALGERYASADVAARRAMLPEIAAAPMPFEQAAKWIQPRFVDSIEYFATPLECCEQVARVAALLRDERAAPLAVAVAGHTPPAIDRARWRNVVSKGGDETGVYAAAIYLERSDGARFAVALAWNYTGADVIRHEANAILLGVIDFLGRLP